MKKKIISGLLALAMVLGSGAPVVESGLGVKTAISASALTYGDYSYKVIDGGNVEITGWSGTDEVLNIPSEIYGKKVTSIGKEALSDRNILTSVTIPAGVTEIGNDAFWDCKNIKEITIPDSVTKIGGGAFDGCESLTNLTLPKNITVIGWSTFSGCKSLTSIAIPNGVTIISDFAFYNCTSLTNVTIPDSVTEIGFHAFYGCESLTSVTIPNGITSIDDEAFGYHDYEGSGGVKIAGFKINCYSNTAGHNYAKENGFDYVLLDHTTHTWDGGKITKAATCKATGTKTYTCTVCGETKTETIAKTAHKYKTKVVNPTFTAKGYTLHKCSVCGKSYKDKYTAKLSRDVSKSKVMVSKTKAYTGKAIKPSVTVKIGTVKLKKNTDYTVSYKNNKKTGKATITIKGKGKFKGKKTASFIIVPKKPGTPTAKALGGKKIKVTVKKDKMATGYQIQVSTSKKFTKKTTKTATLTKTAKTFTKLKKGKKYYVRTRSYKKVGKTKYYGAYSKLKTVKCK